MNKKIVLICLIVMTLVLGIIVFAKINYKSYQYNDLIISEKEWDSIIKGRQESQYYMVSKLKFNDYEAIYDNSSNEYYYSLVEDAHNRYNPDVMFVPNGINIKMAILDKKITDELIESNDTISVMFYNNDYYQMSNIKCTTLSIMNIECLDDILYHQDVQMKVSLFDNRSDVLNRFINSEGKIHVRGYTSATFEKQSYKISLTTQSLGNHTRKNHQSLLGMRYDDDWILYAAYNDQEKIRNVLASNLWYESCAKNNMFGVNNGYEYKYLELFINSKYYGLYALGFQIDEKQLDLNESSEYMFKKIDWGNPLKTQTDMANYYKFINISKEDGNGWNTLTEYLCKLENGSVDELYQMSDINNIIDHYLFNNLTQGVDNGNGMDGKNMYINFKEWQDRKVAIYTPWDLDFTFGNAWGKEDQNYVRPYQIPTNDNIIFLLSPLGYLQEKGDTQINNLIKNRYAELRSNYWSEQYLGNMIDDYENKIYNSGAFRRDKERWPDGTYNDEEEKLSRFKNYVFERLQYMDEFVNSL